MRGKKSRCICIVVSVLLAAIPSANSFRGLGMLPSGPSRMVLTKASTAAAAAATPAAAAAADSRLTMGRQHITTRRASGLTSCEMTGARRAGGGGGVSSLLLGLLVAASVGGASHPAIAADGSDASPPLPPLQRANYYDQVADAMPLKTMRGIWRFNEVREGKACSGTLTFQGQLDQPNRGDVLFGGSGRNAGPSDDDVAEAGSKTSCMSEGKGKWLMKPRRFERATIQFSSRWKIRSPEGTFVYKGDVQADGVKNKNNVVDATIRGEVFREEQGSGGRGSAPEKLTRVGTFEAELREQLKNKKAVPEEPRP